MYSWTPLLMGVRGNYPAIVSLLLQYSPNVNAVDQGRESQRIKMHRLGYRFLNLYPKVEVIKLNSAKIYRFLQLLSHSCGFFARV
jgi:hypothetical protein